MSRMGSAVRYVLTGAMLVVPAMAGAQALTSTGVDVVAGQDQRWSVSWAGALGSGSLANAFVINPIPGVWEPNSPGNYAWIGVNESGSLPDGAGDNVLRETYTFSTTFDFPGSFVISFMCAKDNALVNYAVNGLVTADPLACGAPNVFTFGPEQFAPGAFLPTGNTLTFTTAGDGLTDGLLVQIIPTPEPASMALLGTGLLGVFGAAWRRKRAA